MSLTVEDGSIVADAESLASVAYFQSYWAKRGDETTAELDAEVIEPALRKATDFLCGNWTFDGELVSTAQALAWPRYLPGGIDADGRAVATNVIPKPIKDAVCELAKESMTTPLAASVDRGGMVEEITVGPITKKFAQGAPSAKKYALVEVLLRSLVSGGGSSISSTARRG